MLGFQASRIKFWSFWRLDFFVLGKKLFLISFWRIQRRYEWRKYPRERFCKMCGIVIVVTCYKTASKERCNLTRSRKTLCCLQLKPEIGFQHLMAGCIGPECLLGLQGKISATDIFSFNTFPATNIINLLEPIFQNCKFPIWKNSLKRLKQLWEHVARGQVPCSLSNAEVKLHWTWTVLRWEAIRELLVLLVWVRILKLLRDEWAVTN